MNGTDSDSTHHSSDFPFERGSSYVLALTTSSLYSIDFSYPGGSPFPGSTSCLGSTYSTSSGGEGAGSEMVEGSATT